jgi:hypothetical protein
LAPAIADRALDMLEDAGSSSCSQNAGGV